MIIQLFFQLYAIIILILNFDSAIYFVNDDSLLIEIISDKGMPSDNLVVPYLSEILSEIISLIYINWEIGISIYGLFFLFTNLMIIFGVSNLIHYTKNELSFLIILMFNLLMIPISILSPTFTIVAILATGVGIIGSILYFKTSGKKLIVFTFYFFLMVLGFLIRPQAFFGTAILFITLSITIILIYFKKIKLNFLLLGSQISIFGLIILVNNYFKEKSENQNIYSLEFTKFNNLYSSISYTPDLLKIHQEIIAGNIMQGIWSNVDFILLREWVYADNFVYNSNNLRKAIESISNNSGFLDFLKIDFKAVLVQIFNETQNFLSILLMFILTFLLSIYLKKFSRNKILLFSNVILSYFLVFYYLLSFSRLPTRVTFPFLLLLLLSLVVIFDKEREIITKKQKTFFIVYFVIFMSTIVNFHVQNDFGLKKIMEQNLLKLNNSILRDQELLSFNKSAIYVGPVSFFPISSALAYSESNVWISNANTLPLSWATFSPYWRNLAKRLDLDVNNIYNSLATKEDVYWVSDSRIAEILNMYMNDHNIYRGKLCSFAKLSGNDNAEIFTFQAKEDDC